VLSLDASLFVILINSRVRSEIASFLIYHLANMIFLSFFFFGTDLLGLVGIYTSIRQKSNQLLYLSFFPEFDSKIEHILLKITLVENLE
jgi:hypothetical protein